jgi:hypothetical protein
MSTLALALLLTMHNWLPEAIHLKALVAGNSLSIGLQDISGLPIEGSGTYSNNSFVLNYTVDEGDGPIQVNATYTR